MTPRELDTLTTILGHVGYHNARVVVDFKAHPVLMSEGYADCGFIVRPDGGIAIDGVVFAPERKGAA